MAHTVKVSCSPLKGIDVQHILTEESKAVKKRVNATRQCCHSFSLLLINMETQ